MNTASIFQFIDSSLPVGGFVYSMGMESAIKSNALKTEEDLKRYLLTYAAQLFSFEFPFLDAAYHASDQCTTWSSLVTTYKVMLMNPPVEKSALVLGKNWLRLLSSLFEHQEMVDLKNNLETQKTALYYTLIFGMSMKALGVSLSQTREMYLYTALRDQVTVLTRLGTIGPMGGQKLLAYLLTQTEVTLKQYIEVPYIQAKKSAYLMEIMQMNHDKIYSKLFQN